MKLLIFIVTLLTSLVSIAKSRVIYKDVQIYTTDNLQPIVILDKKEIGGFFGEFFLNSTKEIVTSYKINNYPWPRTQMELKKNVNSIIFPFARNKAREKDYKWIFKLYDDPVCFYTKNSNKKINTIAEAEKMHSIGYLRNGPEIELINKMSENIKKIDSASISELLVKLFKQEIDIVVGGSYLKYIWKMNNFKEDSLNCGTTLYKNELYIASSIKSNDNFIFDLRNAMEKYQKTKNFNQLNEKYKYLWQ